MSRLLVAALLVASPLLAQDTPQSIRLVLPHGPGSITVSTAGGWEPAEFHLYDDGARPAMELTNKQLHLELSYLMFANDTGAPTAESCRDAVIPSILANLGTTVTVKDKQAATRTLKSGQTLAVGSYLIAKAGEIPIQQENVFGFLGDAKTCAEIHVSKVRYTAADKHLLDAQLDAFTFDPAYAPSAVDYGTIGTIFYNTTHDMASAAIYYQRTLDTLPNAPVNGIDPLTIRRVTTDNLAMAYGMSGDLKRSRAVNEAAIDQDPDYPLYYYSLACADAEEGNAAAARTHLEQAFARRANTIKGETLPDPSADDSILKLKGDTAFWAFVQTLPKS